MNLGKIIGTCSGRQSVIQIAFFAGNYKPKKEWRYRYGKE
jgi:hypothetical protein